MRAFGAIFLLILATCGSDPEDPDSHASKSSAVADGFLRYLPANAQLVARLPSPQRIKEAPKAVGNLLRCLGHGGSDSAQLLYQTAKLSGIDTRRAAGLVTLPGGGWVHYLPAADKGLLNQALADLVTKYALQEEDDWITVSSAGGKPGRVEGEPLPRGDVAARWKHHPLLDAVAQPGDRLDIGGTLLEGGIELSGRLVPGAGSPTADAVAHAGGELAGNIDLLPAWLGVRFESTLPPTIYATLLTRRIARQAGLPAGDLRDNLESFLREATTAIDPGTGLAVGIEFRNGTASFVAVGAIAEGPASPVLAKLSKARRATFGGLVLDERETKKGLTGFYAWCPQPKPNTDVPDSLALVLDNLLREDAGVPVTYVAAEGYAVVAAGPRADALALKVGRRVVSGAQASVGSRQLVQLRRRGGEGCVFGAIVSGAGLNGMAKADRAHLRAMFHAGANAVVPKLIVLAGFRGDAGGLRIEGRVIY